MFPSTLMRKSFDDRVLDDDKLLAIPHHGLLDVAGPVVAASSAVSLSSVMANGAQLSPPTLDSFAKTPELDAAMTRMMGDLGALNLLVRTLRDRLVCHLPVGRILPPSAHDDRPGHGTARHVVALDNAAERLVDLHMEVAAMIAALQQ